MPVNDFLEKLDPKTRKRIQTAQNTETIRLPLASVGLTDALGGGIGAGRVTTVFGNTSAGKSVLMQQSIGQWQEQGLICAYGDSEMTFDKKWAARLGVDNDELILIQKRSVGAMTDEVVPLIQAGIDVLVIDSISDLLPEAFVDEKGEMKQFEKQKQIGAHARSISIMLNALHYVNEKTAIICLSQTTTDLSGMYPVQIPMGGKKLGFASSQIIKLNSTKSDIKKDSVVVGENVYEEPNRREVEYTVEKNKMAPAHGVGKYTVRFQGSEVGIDREDELVRLAKRYGVIEGSTWLAFEDVKHQGGENFSKALKADPDLFGRIQSKLHLVKTGELPNE
jgi:RecA/RadA recombinase